MAHDGREIDVLHAGVEEEGVNVAARAVAVQPGFEGRARESRAKFGEMPAHRRIAVAGCRAAEQDAAAFGALLCDDVVQACAGSDVRFNRAANECVRFADVPFDHRGARALAQDDDDLRKDGRWLRCARKDEHERFVELHARRHENERAAIAECRRERCVAVRAPVDDPMQDVADEGGMRPLRVG